MKTILESPNQYIEQLPLERKNAMQDLRKTILENLPQGFIETISYGMIGYVVPHSIYRNGYHCDPKQPLPFMSIASQKNFIAIYHMGLYAENSLLEWFTGTYKKNCYSKLDIGKSCIRFKKLDQIPFQIIGELTKKISLIEWIEIYENKLKK